MIYILLPPVQLYHFKNAQLARKFIAEQNLKAPYYLFGKNNLPRLPLLYVKDCLAACNRRIHPDQPPHEQLEDYIRELQKVCGVPVMSRSIRRHTKKSPKPAVIKRTMPDKHKGRTYFDNAKRLKWLRKNIDTKVERKRRYYRTRTVGGFLQAGGTAKDLRRELYAGNVRIV